MAWENDAGLNVHNFYGPRTLGGQSGVTMGEYGINNYWSINLPSAGLNSPFPVANNPEITSVDVSFVTAGTITSITIGGVSVYNTTSQPTYPVKIANTNTGVVVVTGGTTGTALLAFRNISGDTTNFA
jgi:hypothetical protein